ncbi:hypothetical protein EIP86_002397 [Pleurotus ostreatoroseus]|nr:hypothetical protein EIP86_002397 [Pleurotus ostreatoroseus]
MSDPSPGQRHFLGGGLPGAVLKQEPPPGDNINNLNSSSHSTRKRTAMQAAESSTSRLYAPGGALDSQCSDSQFVRDLSDRDDTGSDTEHCTAAKRPCTPIKNNDLEVPLPRSLHKNTETISNSKDIETLSASTFQSLDRLQCDFRALHKVYQSQLSLKDQRIRQLETQLAAVRAAVNILNPVDDSDGEPMSEDEQRTGFKTRGSSVFLDGSQLPPGDSPPRKRHRV